MRLRGKNMTVKVGGKGTAVFHISNGDNEWKNVGLNDALHEPEARVNCRCVTATEKIDFLSLPYVLPSLSALSEREGRQCFYTQS